MSAASQRDGLAGSAPDRLSAPGDTENPVASQPFSLRECVESTVTLARTNATRRSVKIAEVVQARVPDSVCGDSARLRQSLLNLLSDAIKFAPAGGQIALLVTSQESGELHDVHFVVSDSGSSSTLAFTIPLTATGPAAALPRDLAEEHPLRILVAEDNLVNQMVVRLLLARLGYAPDFVGNGREALAAVEKRPYDVVLMDLHMPVLDGLAATQELCARYPQPQRPRIIALTASIGADDRRAAEAAGMDDFLPKPVDARAIVAALRRCTRIDAGARD